MHRKSFLKNTALCAMAFTTTGFIKFNGFDFEGDCETTSDILGPFYRPNSPVRSSLLIKNMPGPVVELSGTIKHNDCKTPYSKAKIELWHCNSEGVYDNSSNEYRYRGTMYSDEQGRYSFKTILPPPYDAGGMIRPAHFHLMVSAEGYQSLVTQLYFSGDSNIPKDTWASSPKAKKRILTVQSLKDGTKKVLFDVSMASKLSAEPASLERLTGIYADEKNGSNSIEFFQKDKMLWVKNEVYGKSLEYLGDNKFLTSGSPANDGFIYQFEVLATGVVKVTYENRRLRGEKGAEIAVKR